MIDLYKMTRFHIMFKNFKFGVSNCLVVLFLIASEN